MDCDRSRHSFPSSIASEIDRRLNKNSERNRGGTTTNTLTSCVRWQEIHDRSPAHKWRRYISTTPPNSLAGVKGALQCGRSDHNHSTKLPEFSPTKQFFFLDTHTFLWRTILINFWICLNLSWNIIWNYLLYKIILNYRRVLMYQKDRCFTQNAIQPNVIRRNDRITGISMQRVIRLLLHVCL